MWNVVCDLFLNAKNIKLAEIHCQIYDIYGENAMSDLVVMQRCVQFSMKDMTYA